MVTKWEVNKPATHLFSPSFHDLLSSGGTNAKSQTEGQYMDIPINTQVVETHSAKPGQLQRATFSTSRLLDFCSEKELTNLTGHPPEEWPLVVVKELVDNAID